jgi:hypothetical protein
VALALALAIARCAGWIFMNVFKHGVWEDTLGDTATATWLAFLYLDE